MDNKNIPTAQFSAISLYLTPAALLWLNGMTKGIPHLTIYNDLLFAMTTTESTTRKRGIDVSLKQREVEASANGLGERWHIGRKVMTRLLDEMEQLGLLKLERSKLTSIATMTSVMDYDLTASPSDTAQQNESQAEQPTAAPPDSGSGAPSGASGMADSVCDVNSTASDVAVEISPQDSAIPNKDAPLEQSSDSPTTEPRTYSEPTLFDGMEA